MKRKELTAKIIKATSTILLGTFFITLGSVDSIITYAKDNSNFKNLEDSESLKNNPNLELENVNIYRKTSIKPTDPREQKKFNINLHTLEPLGVEVLEGSTIEIQITGDNIQGYGELYVHNVDNVKHVQKINVGEITKVTVPYKGQLFLDINNITYSLNEQTPFDFDVKMILENDNYIETPTFDVRENKISDDIITNPTEFVEQVKAPENAENGMLMISDNVRMYFPQSKYVPDNFDPEEVLRLHEDTIREDNTFAGLDENDSNIINQPRKNFFLVSARNEQAGYMSAGGQMLDTHPKNTKEYFVPGWGMYHEYGHLYEQAWSHIEIWNNMFSKHMTEQTIGFTWLWGNDRPGFETSTIKPFYTKYVNNETPSRDFDFKDGLYFFVTLEEAFGKDFVGNLEKYWRENENLPQKIDYVAYAMAKIYGVNIIPYIELYGLKVNSDAVYKDVIELSNSTFFHIPENSSFDEFRSISPKPTINGIYEGENVVLSGIANKGSELTLEVDGTIYTATADENSKFSITIPGTIDVHTHMTLTSKDPGKDPSLSVRIKAQNELTDNKFNLQGYGDGVKLVLGFDPTDMVLTARSSGDQIHWVFDDEYFSVQLYGKNGDLKVSKGAIGTGNANELAKALNNQPFEYGDYITITHRESGRAKLYGNVANAPKDLSTGFSGVDLATSYFYITENGLEYSNSIK